MSTKNLEMMKKLIEAQKQKSAEQSGVTRHDKKVGEQRTAIKKFKKGGLFDK